MNEVARPCAEFLALLCCGLFAGAASYVSFVEHPARMECGTELAVKEFRPSYRRASVMQFSLALLGSLAALAAWWQGHEIGWLIGGVLFISVIPVTLILIMPTNRKLLDPALDSTGETVKLLRRWGFLHLLRTALSIIALIVFLDVAIFE